jgi:hypothetical protein
MPISKEEWDLGKKSDTFEKQILSFLKKNPDIAYSLPEIVSALGYNIEIRDLGSFVGGVAGFWLFQNAIENLVKEGTVEARKIAKITGEQTYYKATLRALQIEP